MYRNKILIIDDEQDFLDFVGERLKLEEYDVITALDGEDGLQKAKTWHPDLIICDVNMPKKDGFEVLKEACSDIALYRVLKKTPIIMLSNYSNQQDIDYCIKNGAQDFLIKSEWTPEAIIKKVKEYLEEK